MRLSSGDIEAIRAVDARMIAANTDRAMSRRRLDEVTELCTAETQGIVSYAYDLGRHRCPYVPQSDLALAWLKGWDAAHLRAHPEDAP